MNKYSQERKDQILKLLLPPYNLTPTEAAKQEGISGFYMLYFLNAWHRYQDLQFLWLHLMTCIWVIFSCTLNKEPTRNQQRINS